MATLTVLKFYTTTGADEALTIVKDLQAQNLIELDDAAIVTWPEDKKKPKTQQLNDLKTSGALWGGFWGMLFGLIFLVPIAGLIVGGIFGAVAAHFADVGIDDKFISAVRGKVTKGTSALFLMTRNAVTDRVVEAFKKMKFEIVSTNLPKEKEDQLRQAFADD